MSALSSMWKQEMTGSALRMIRVAWIHDEAHAIEIAEEAIEAGADDAQIIALLEQLMARESKGGGEQ
jgi:hypothetical protein